MAEFKTYLTFDAGVGVIRPIRAQGTINADNYLAIYGLNNDLMLFLGGSEQPGQLVVGGKIGKDWVDVQRVPFDSRNGGMTVLLNPVGEQAIDIELENGTIIRFRTRAPLSGARSVGGSGDWAVEQTRTTTDEKRGAPPASALTEFEGFPALGPRAAKDLIYDVGMHVATDTEFYLKKGFRVVAVEANPILAEAAARRLSGWIRIGRLVILNMGMAPIAGSFPFYVNKTHSEWSSFDEAIASRGHEVERIQVRTLPPEDIFAVFGAPYFIKIDIEGYDGLVVEAATRLPEPPLYISFENGDVPIFEKLVEAGYTGFKLINQRTVPELRLPAPSREGLTIEHSFAYGSSGPFGEDTPGQWIAPKEMREALAIHFGARAGQKGPDVDWWDLHAARLPASRRTRR